MLSVPRVHDHPQRDFGAEDIVQHGHDVCLKAVFNPVARKRGIDREHDLVGCELDQAHRFEPHLKDRFVIPGFETFECRRPKI